MVSKEKINIVEKLSKQIEEYPVVGVVNMQDLPAQQLQVMKAMLREKGIIITMTRKRLIQRALEQVKKENIQRLIEKLVGMPAVLLTKDNPFALYALLEKNKSHAPAKAGQIAPKDIIVKAGPTNFSPGPIISELGAAGIKTKVDAGKLAIINDVLVVKEGEEISPKISDVLKRLDIQPMEVGLDLRVVWENGLIFDAKQLHIDENEFTDNVCQAAAWAFNLAIETAYPTSDTIELLLSKAFRESKAVAVGGDIITDVTAEEVIGKVEREALALQQEANVEVVERKREIKEEEEVQVKEEKSGSPAEEIKSKEKSTEEIVEEKKPVEEERLEGSVTGERNVEETPTEEPKKEPVEALAEEPGKGSAEELPEEPEEEKKDEQPEQVSEEQPKEEVKEEHSMELAEEPIVEPWPGPEPIEEPEPNRSDENEEEKPAEKEEVSAGKPKKEESDNQQQKEEKVEEAQEQQAEEIPIEEVFQKKEEGSPGPRYNFQLQKEEKVSADELIQQVEEEFQDDDDEVIQKEGEDEKEVREAEELFEKLKKEGTLRKEE